MTLIICLDLKNGMAFNKRRQSRDSVVIDRICDLVATSSLHISKYSSPLFSLPYSNINVCELPFLKAGKGEFCFLENNVTEDIVNRAEKLIVFRWDKVYPQDTAFDINPDEWKLVSTKKFRGSSHDEITEEVYVK